MNKEEFVSRIYSKNYINKQIVKIKLLGTGTKIDVYNLIISRLVSSVMIFFIILYVFDYGYIFAPLITFGYYFCFDKFVIDDM